MLQDEQAGNRTYISAVHRTSAIPDLQESLYMMRKEEDLANRLAEFKVKVKYKNGVKVGHSIECI